MRKRLLLCNATKNVSTECKISWKSNGEGTLKEGHPLSKLDSGGVSLQEVNTGAFLQN